MLIVYGIEQFFWSQKRAFDPDLPSRNTVISIVIVQKLRRKMPWITQ
jgi:hypothetical protein